MSILFSSKRLCNLLGFLHAGSLLSSALSKTCATNFASHRLSACFALLCLQSDDVEIANLQ